MVKKLTILFLSFLLNISYINAVFSIEADVFVQSTVNRAADTLGGNLSKNERIEELKSGVDRTAEVSSRELRSAKKLKFVKLQHIKLK